MKKEARALLPEPASSDTANHSPTTTKQLKTLCCLLRGPRHRFDAERWGDHCLHTTVATLRRDHTIDCDRQWVEVPNRFGTRTRVKQYWVSAGCADKARRLAAAAGRVHRRR